jgi:hypothetical protein
MMDVILLGRVRQVELLLINLILLPAVTAYFITLFEVQKVNPN